MTKCEHNTFWQYTVCVVCQTTMTQTWSNAKCCEGWYHYSCMGIKRERERDSKSLEVWLLHTAATGDSVRKPIEFQYKFSAAKDGGSLMKLCCSIINFTSFLARFVNVKLCSINIIIRSLVCAWNIYTLAWVTPQTLTPRRELPRGVIRIRGGHSCLGKNVRGVIHT